MTGPVQRDDRLACSGRAANYRSRIGRHPSRSADLFVGKLHQAVVHPGQVSAQAECGLKIGTEHLSCLAYFLRSQPPGLAAPLPHVVGVPVSLQRTDVLHHRLPERPSIDKNLGNDLDTRRREGRVRHDHPETEQDIAKARPCGSQLFAYRTQRAHCLCPRALALLEAAKVAAVGPDSVDTSNVTSLDFQGEDAPFGQDHNVRLAPDLALVAGKPERVKHDPAVRQLTTEPCVDVPLAVRTVLGYVGYQDGQPVSPIASPK